MENEATPVEPATDKPIITIEYCPKCHWMLKATYMAQEFLTTFTGDIKGVLLLPSEIGDDINLLIIIKCLTGKGSAHFPEIIKELKQMIRI